MSNRSGYFYALIIKKNIVLVLSAFLFVVGATIYTILPKQEYPLVPIPLAIVSAVYPGVSAEEMEQLVTKKIEDVVMEADGFYSTMSETFDGVSIVMVNFDVDMPTDELEESKRNLRYKINDLESELPEGVTNLKYNTDTTETAGLILSITGEGKSNAELVQRAEELKLTLQYLNGVKKVEVDGESKDEIHVVVDTDEFNRMDLSLSELSTIISSQNSLIPIGNLTFDSNKIVVNSSGKIDSIEELGEIIVSISQDSGAVTQLKDIASIEKVVNENSKLYRYNGQEAVLINLYYQDGINVVTTGSSIIEQVELFKKNLPHDIQINTVVNLAEDVNKSVSNFTNSVLQAIVIVLVVILLGMNFRNALIVAVAIPLSLVATFIVMYFTNIDIQFISLASLIMVLGTLIDNVIVVCDSIQVRIDNGEDKIDACANGTKSVVSPVLSATLTSASIYLMFYMLPGTMKTFAWSLPTIIISALIISYIVSLTVTPVMCYLLMKKSKSKKQGKIYIIDKMGNTVSKILDKALTYKKLTIMCSIITLIISAALLSTLDMEFLPKAEKDIIDISVLTSNLTDIRKTEDIVKLVEEIVTSQPETMYTLSSVGGSVPKYNFAATPSNDSVNTGGLIVGFDLSKGQRFDETSVFVEYLQNEIDSNIGGSKIEVKEIGIMPEIYASIQVRITGDNFTTLNQVAHIIEEEMKNIDGITNIYSNTQYKTHKYFIDMHNTTLNSLGLTKAEVQLELNSALMGTNTTIYRKDKKEFPIIVTSSIETLNDLENFMIKSNTTGSKHQLRQIANVSLQEEYSYITRYNGHRTITITGSPKVGYSSITLQAELQRILNEKDFGDDITLIYEGEIKDLYQAIGGMIKGAGVGLMGIILVLYIQFYSFRKTIIVLTSIPFCFVGATLGLVIFRPGLSLFTMLGILSLMGIVVTNAIVLVDCIDNERETGVSIREACKIASSKRFRPIWLSTVTTVLGMLPLALAGNPLFRGLAIAFMSGAALSMFFTLIIVPLAYYILESTLSNNRIELKN